MDPADESGGMTMELPERIREDVVEGEGSIANRLEDSLDQEEHRQAQVNAMKCNAGSSIVLSSPFTSFLANPP